MPQRELARALPADFEIVRQNAGRVTDFAALTAQSLVLVGTKTRPYLRVAADALTAAIPGVQRVDLEGAMHSATQNADQWGQPAKVAPALREFFAA